MVTKRLYCLGFAFTPDTHKVLLVEKAQGLHVGHLNGLGGVIGNEGLVSAMEREFFEESGIRIPTEQWTWGGALESQEPNAWTVHVFRATLPEETERLPLPQGDAGRLDLFFTGHLHVRGTLFAPHTRSFIHAMRDQILFGVEHTPPLWMKENRS